MAVPTRTPAASAAGLFPAGSPLPATTNASTAAPQLRQPRRRYQAVSPVIAGANQDNNPGLCGIPEPGRHLVSHHPAGVFHQFVERDAGFNRRLLQPPHLCGGNRLHFSGSPTPAVIATTEATA